MLVALLALAPWALAQGGGNQPNDNVQIVSGPSVDAKDHSATIRWKTNNQAATIVKYGTDPNNLDKEARHAGGSRDHNVTLAELQPGTTYHFAIMTEAGQTRKTGQFTTQGGAQASNTASQSGSMQTSGAPDDIKITSGPEVRNFNGSTGTLYWETDKTAANHVKYGLDANNLDQTGYERGGSRQHSIELKNLQAGKTYHFQILRRDGSARHSGTFTLPQTAQASQSIPVRMAEGTQAATSASASASGQAQSVQITQGPTIEYADDKSAIIAWSTNVQASTKLMYGTDQNNLNQTGQAPWGGTTHRVELKNLQPNTTYFFRIESAQASGTGTMAERGTFAFTTPANAQAAIRQQPAQPASQAQAQTQTVGTTGASSATVGSGGQMGQQAGGVQITSGPTVEYVDDKSAVIAWSTNVKSSSVVRYGNSVQGLTQTATAPWGDTTHRVTLNNLQPNTRYFFRVESSQAEGTGTATVSRPMGFQTVRPGEQARGVKR